MPSDAEGMAMAQGYLNAINAAGSYEDLYKTILRFQSGYVGGTSPQAVATGIRSTYTGAELAKMVAGGDITLPTGKTLEAMGFGDAKKSYETAWGVGNANPYYVSYSQQGWQKAAGKNPEGIYASIQMGVDQSLLAGSNKTIAAALGRRFNTESKTVLPEVARQVAQAANAPKGRPGATILTNPLGTEADDEFKSKTISLLGE